MTAESRTPCLASKTKTNARTRRVPRRLDACSGDRWLERATGRRGFADLTKPDPHHTPPPPRRLTLRARAWHPKCREPEARRGLPSQEGRAMFSHAIVLATLTHPLHVLLFGVILSRLAREVVSAAARAREASRVESRGD